MAAADLVLEAWAEYLEACRAAGDRYDVVEVWAWERLQARLKRAKRLPANNA